VAERVGAGRQRYGVDVSWLSFSVLLLEQDDITFRSHREDGIG
jgi:hypothetical protein